MKRENKIEFCLKDFDFGKRLGEGYEGEVNACLHKKLLKEYAVKTIKIGDPNSLVYKKHMREIKIHKQLNHPNIIKLNGYFVEKGKLYMIYDLAKDGDLWKLLKKNKRFSEEVTSKFIYQITKALGYLHCRGIIHRDLKPENVLLDLREGNLKLNDFGLAIQSQTRKNSCCGTLTYLSPEMVTFSCHNEKTDLWSLGILTYELLFGEPPFTSRIKGRNRKEKRIGKKILRMRVTFKDEVKISEEAKDFISRLLRRNMDERMRIVEILNHPFITKYN